MERRLSYMFALIAVGALLHSPAGAVADTSGGLAWDSVTKFMQAPDPSALQPGSFDSDYATASQVQLDTKTGGGLFAAIKQAESLGSSMQELMRNGIAERHYVAGSKERTDQVAYQTATIVDCDARTITHLDLRAKTYRVTSMDSSATSPNMNAYPVSGAPQVRPTDSNAKVAIALTNTALGSLQVEGQSTSGFRSNMKLTETNQKGASQTLNAQLVGYYTTRPNPEPACSRMGPAPGGSNVAAMMTAATHFKQALVSAGTDRRVSLSQSGPPLPAGNLSMYDAVTLTGGGRGGATFVTERGNLRPIDPNDPVFGVPSGFTQQQ